MLKHGLNLLPNRFINILTISDAWINVVNFFTNEEFDLFDMEPSLAHRKMMLNAIAKLQTPNQVIHSQIPIFRV